MSANEPCPHCGRPWCVPVEVVLVGGPLDGQGFVSCGYEPREYLIPTPAGRQARYVFSGNRYCFADYSKSEAFNG